MNSTAPGSTTPISPLVSRPSAQATKPARAQPACGVSACSASAEAGASKKASAKHQMAEAIHAATSMSWLMYWPPSKNAGLVASIQAAGRASRSPVRRRAAA